jgi:hypothetical protein
MSNIYDDRAYPMSPRSSEPAPECPNCKLLRQALGPFGKAWRDWRVLPIFSGSSPQNRVTREDFQRAEKALKATR